MDTQISESRHALRVHGAGVLKSSTGSGKHPINRNCVATLDSHDSMAARVDRLRTVLGELFIAVDDALSDPNRCPEERIGRVSDLLRNDPELHRLLVTPDAANAPMPEARAHGGLTPWKARVLKQHIEAHLQGTLSNKDLALFVGLSESHFCRAFKDSFGDAPHRYISRRRIDQARRLLLTTSASLGQIAMDCGLADQAHFCRLFRKFQGQSPGAFRRVRAREEAQTTSGACGIR
jgi:AraC family transcriptional regulator